MKYFIVIVSIFLLSGCESIFSPKTIDRLLKTPNPNDSSLDDRCFVLTNGIKGDDYIYDNNKKWWLKVKIINFKF
jgi:hypothetical protein